MASNNILKDTSGTNSRRNFLEKLGLGSLMFSSGGGQFLDVVENQNDQTDPKKNPNWDPYDFGAKGDARTMDTKAIQAAVDKCHLEGGGTVYLHNGRFLSGTIYLKSNVILNIEAGAILSGSDNPDDFPSTESKHPSFNGEFVTHKSLIYAEDSKNITICGRGTIDGRGDDLVLKAPYLSPSFSGRPRILNFRGCENVQIRDITLYNSGSWVQTYQSCKNIVIDGISVNSRENKDIEKPRFADAPGRNNDGLDLVDSEFVRISNCYINSGDDAIVIKSNSPDEGCRNISITNCTVSSNASGIKFGTDSAGAFEDITISNCTVFDTRSDAISVLTVDGARVARINISNITIRNIKGSAIFIRLGNRGTTYRKNAKVNSGILKDVIIENIQGTRISSEYGSSVTGIGNLQVENIILRNINLEFEGGGKKEDVDRPIPENEKGYPNGKMFGVLPAYGFFIRHAKNIILDNVQLRFKEQDSRAALFCDDVEELKIKDLRAMGSLEDTGLICLNNCKRTFISGSSPGNRIKTFLKLTGNKSEDVILTNNYLKSVSQALFFDKKSLSENTVIDLGNIR